MSQSDQILLVYIRSVDSLSFKETARTFHRREHHVPTLLDPLAQNRERMPKQTKQDLALTVVGVDLAETALDRLGHVRLAV